MKKAILFFLLALPFVVSAQTVNRVPITANTIAELKTKPIDSTAVYFVINKAGMGDTGGGTYVWVYGATDAEDLVYSNIITSNVSTAGRFYRTTNRNTVLSAGLLKNDGGTKTIILNATTPSNGIVTYNLTSDGTASGAAILTQDPWIIFAGPRVSSLSTPNDIVFGQCTTLSANRKQLTCMYGRGSSALINTSLVTGGLTIVGFREPVTGTPVSVMVIGM